MLNLKPARRYAAALFQAAQRANALDQVHAQLRSLAEGVRRFPRAARLLSSPILPAERKQRALRAGLGPEASPPLLSLIDLLVRKNRLALLPEIADFYHQLLNQHRRLCEVEAASAVPLLPDEEQRLTRILERLTGRRVILRKRLDPRLLGGLRLTYDDVLIEGSVRAALRAMQARLLSATIPSIPSTTCLLYTSPSPRD